MDEIVHERAAILSVGDELVFGESLDTNSRWIAERLIGLGVRVIEHATVADDLERQTATILRLAAANPLLIVTGGLGPTRDDLTRQALARAMDEKLIEDEGALEELERVLQSRGRELTDERRLQALRPQSAECLRNDVGTAPGLAARIVSPVEIQELGEVEGGVLSREEDVCDVLCLPGPPREMMPMFERDVPRFVRSPQDRTIRVRLIRTYGLPEADVASRLGAMMDRGRNPTIGTTASGGVVTIRVRQIGSAGAADAAADEAVSEIRKRLSEYVFGEGNATLAEAVLDVLRERGERLVVVESCSGGMLGATITSVPGSSDVFDGGWITYANTMKVGEVGVKENLITGGPGAVSREVAEAMASGALEAAIREGVNADHALAITGIAGPGGGSEEKPVGTVWVCRASRIGEGKEASVEVDARRFLIPGDRDDIRERSATMGLGMLWHHAARGQTPSLIWEVAEEEVVKG